VEIRHRKEAMLAEPEPADREEALQREGLKLLARIRQQL
jgi:hypothetical protein